MNLEELQSLMWRAITWPTGTQDFLAQADATTRAHFEQAFAGSDAFGAVERMDVYANAYYWRLHGVLAENHPTAAWLMGHDQLVNLGTDYLLTHPSTHPDLRHVGEHFAAFIGQHQLTRDRPYLAALAQLEHAISDALHGPDVDAMQVDELTALAPQDWPELRLSVVPSLRIFDVPWDYLALVRARESGEQAPPSPPVLDPDTRLLMWRRGHRVRHRRLTAPEASVLAFVGGGTSFAHLCAHLADEASEKTAAGLEVKLAYDSIAQRAATWLRQWVQEGLLKGASGPVPDDPSGTPS